MCAVRVSPTPHVIVCYSADASIPERDVLKYLPQLAENYVRFEQYLPTADRSTQHLYQLLHGLVLPLERPEDPQQGVLRPMTRVQLREEQQTWRGIEEQWANQTSQPHRSSTY
jgi:hypothetical protein